MGFTPKADPAHVQLIESCLRGEQRAWTLLVAKYERLIYSVAHKLCPEMEDCADVFQRVCLALYQNLDRLRSDQAIPAWLTTVTRRQAYKVIRAKKPYSQIDEDAVTVEPNLDLIKKEFEVQLAIERLDDRCQKMIHLLYFDSKEPSYAEIGAELGMPAASVGPTRARCLDKLRKLLSA